MLSLNLSNIQLKLATKEGKACVFDPIRKKWIILTPEEHVRQYIIAHLTGPMQYPAAMIAVEKTLKVGAMNKRFDMVIYGRDHTPWMLVECKEPEIPISEATLHQLLNYQRTLQSHYWLLTNGHQTFCADARNIDDIRWMNELPVYGI